MPFTNSKIPILSSNLNSTTNQPLTLTLTSFPPLLIFKSNRSISHQRTKFSDTSEFLIFPIFTSSSSTKSTVTPGRAHPALQELIINFKSKSVSEYRHVIGFRHRRFFHEHYQLNDEKSVLTLRIHTSVCDRAASLALMRKLLELMSEEDGEGAELELGENVEVGLGIEEYIPTGKANKPFWARGIDMVGYGLNSLRFSNLKFMDSESTRGSQVVKLQLNKEDTDRILDGCKTRGIKLCGLLAAAGLIAAHSSKGLNENQWEKYAIVTLINCRSILDPVLSPDFPGFYHSAILNTHDVKGGDDLWELAKRSYTSFANSKNNNKHFSDMGDLNFLMCRAIDNPGLTPSSSLRTSSISVFEDPVIGTSSTVHEEIGLEDFIGCASVHGVGPSIAIFDTIRDGKLDCACVYPFPLHTREQMQEFIGEMKRILVDW
ncbi:hypothetical protein RND71_031099 [Anisodus tanguticus]|uniref:Uncharacterized protein n=1 Tax=Anisodus tanguticus TaxID=243964 RepID=A0AAE1RA00_9SOLA|nr:hypothetical protein RND71_031099 [Anisodus tanguticus]